MKKNIVIIGGGIIGLSSAYYLHKEGHQVTVIDQSDISEGASFANAGYIVPSHIIPLAAPGMITKGIKWMLNSSSPFYVKPRWDIEFFKWSWYFYRSSTREKVAHAIPFIKNINLLSRDLYENILSSGDLGNFHFERKGLLLLYKTDQAVTDEWEVAQKAQSEGLTVRHVNQDELKTLEPNVTIDAKGAIYYECDAHSTPKDIMQQLLLYLKKNGVTIKTEETVDEILVENNTVKSIQTNKDSYTADDIVLATGSWSEKIARKIQVRLPLQAGKGYKVDLYRPTEIKFPTVLVECKTAVTPMNGFTRFSGTMELSGINKIIRKERVEAIAQATKAYYPEIEMTTEEKENAQIGLRPISPDGLPYIGKSTSYKNIIFATGHGMMGWSLGPATGKIVSEIISEKKLSMNIDAFHPDRAF
ncbi:MAG: NAD(P)/FAD-dependent oxidoreductase [Ostreibacterium sp.]